jgi:peroxiredoxin (alkyl hydroperoxide reductase subunit C)
MQMTTKSHHETKTLKVGDTAPDFTLTTNQKDEWHLSDFRGKKNVVLAFVPYAFSSVCSTQLPSYEAEIARFRDFNTEVASVSMDSTYSLNAWSKSMGTSFPLLSDFYPQGKVVDLYGVRNRGGFPERALLVIDKQGVIRYIEVLSNPGDMPENTDLFEALQNLP